MNPLPSSPELLSGERPYPLLQGVLAVLLFISLTLPNLVFSGPFFFSTLHLMKWAAALIPLAMGGILTTTADYRVGAAGDYKLGLNEVAIGMPVPKFAVELTRDRLAKKWFTRCIQHAELCSPEQAVDAGFLDEVARRLIRNLDLLESRQRD